MRYALIDTTKNTVVNVIEWDGVSFFTPPENCITVQSDTANAGDGYDGTNIVPQGG